MKKKRKRELLAVAYLVLGVHPHQGRLQRHGYFGRFLTPDVVNRQRQLKKAYIRARQRGAPMQRAMTDAALEVGGYA